MRVEGRGPTWPEPGWEAGDIDCKVCVEHGRELRGDVPGGYSIGFNA